MSDVFSIDVHVKINMSCDDIEACDIVKDVSRLLFIWITFTWWNASQIFDNNNEMLWVYSAFISHSPIEK